MPYKHTALKIPREKNRTIKLNEQYKKDIIERYEQWETMRELGEDYGVSRYTISYIVKPERYLKAKEKYKERRKDWRYYDKRKNTEAVRKHRKYKKELYKSNLLI